MSRKIHLPIFAVIATAIIMSCSPQNNSQYFQHPDPVTIDTNLIIPPAWAFGVLYGGYTDQEKTIKRIGEIQNHDYPIDAYWIDSWFWSYSDMGAGPDNYIDFIADTINFPDRKQMWSFMERNNIKGGFWLWDCIQETGNEEVFNEFNEKGYFSSVYLNKDSWHNKSTSTAMFQNNPGTKGTLNGNIDFDNPEAVTFFKSKMKHFFDEGADFVKLDRTSKISVCKTMFEMTQEFGMETMGRGFILSHTGGMESEDYKKYPTKWTDDTRSDWNIENPLKNFNSWVPYVAFEENIALYTDTSKKTSQIPFLTNDTGGFDKGLTDQLDEELYIRWLQFSMFCPITEVFSQPENQSSNLAWLYSSRADSIFRFYSHLRMQLFPYIYSYAHQTRLAGKNIIGKIPGQLYEYTFGNELLVAPVYEKGAKTRTVFLPEGQWLDYWSGEEFEGNKEHIVETVINQIPLFVKKGSIIPMRNYNHSIESGNNDTLILDIYPDNESSFTLIEDDGKSNDYLNGKYASTTIDLNESNGKLVVTINPVSGYFEGMNDSRTWILSIHSAENPESVRINRKSIGFNYNPSTQTLHIESRKLKKDKSNEFIVSF